MVCFSGELLLKSFGGILAKHLYVNQPLASACWSTW
jgi:hypothetical protein